MALYAAMKLYMGVAFAMYAYVKMYAILPTNIKFLIYFLFFGNFPWYSPKLFMSIVRLIWHSYKSFLDFYLNSSTPALWNIVMDGEGCHIKHWNNYLQKL